MLNEPTEKLKLERVALLKDIEESFRGVNRDGCISWSEAFVRDMYGTEDEQQAARLSDLDGSWEELVDDPNWDPDAGVGGWNFLDVFSIRYYLPAAMVRCIRSGKDEGILYHLTYNSTCWAALNGAQHKCVKRFLRYMVDLYENDWIDPATGEKESGWKYFVQSWRDALATNWSGIVESQWPSNDETLQS